MKNDAREFRLCRYFGNKILFTNDLALIGNAGERQANVRANVGVSGMRPERGTSVQRQAQAYINSSA